MMKFSARTLTASVAGQVWASLTVDQAVVKELTSEAPFDRALTGSPAPDGSLQRWEYCHHWLSDTASSMARQGVSVAATRLVANQNPCSMTLATGTQRNMVVLSQLS